MDGRGYGREDRPVGTRGHTRCSICFAGDTAEGGGGAESTHGEDTGSHANTCHHGVAWRRHAETEAGARGSPCANPFRKTSTSTSTSEPSTHTSLSQPHVFFFFFFFYPCHLCVLPRLLCFVVLYLLFCFCFCFLIHRYFIVICFILTISACIFSYCSIYSACLTLVTPYTSSSHTFCPHHTFQTHTASTTIIFSQHLPTQPSFCTTSLQY